MFWPSSSIISFITLLQHILQHSSYALKSWHLQIGMSRFRVLCMKRVNTRKMCRNRCWLMWWMWRRCWTRIAWKPSLTNDLDTRSCRCLHLIWMRVASRRLRPKNPATFHLTPWKNSEEAFRHRPNTHIHGQVRECRQIPGKYYFRTICDKARQFGFGGHCTPARVKKYKRLYFLLCVNHSWRLLGQSYRIVICRYSNADVTR